LFDTIVGSFRQRLSSLPDKRTGKNTRYGMEDAALSAFSVFFTRTRRVSINPTQKSTSLKPFANLASGE
jgi:hypothetical protein